MRIFKINIFILLAFFASHACFSSEITTNHSLENNYAIPTASDSLEWKYNYQAGMFADGKNKTAWVTGFDMDKHWADIKWKNRNVTVRGVEIDFSPLSVNYYKKNKDAPPKSKSVGRITIKTQIPSSFELIAKAEGKWIVLHSYKENIHWKSPFVAQVIPKNPLDNISEIKLLFSNKNFDELYAVREIKIIGPEYESSTTMCPQWRGKGMWIWGEKKPITPNFGIVKRFFRKVFEIDKIEDIESAKLLFAAHDRGKVFINGQMVARTRVVGVGMKPEKLRVDIPVSVFKNGKNLFAAIGEDIHEVGLRGIIYQLCLKYKNGSKKYIYSDLKESVSSVKQEGWKTSIESFPTWSKPTYMAQATYAIPSMWSLDYTPPYFAGEAKITRIRLNPQTPRAGEKYKLEIEIEINKPLNEDYGIIVKYGFKTPVRINIINYSLGDDFLSPEKFLPSGFKGVKKVVFSGIWPAGTPARLPARISICNKNNQLKINNGPVGRPTIGVHPGKLLFYLGVKKYLFKNKGFPETKIDKLGRLNINGKLYPPIFYTSSNDYLEHFFDWLKSGVDLFRILPQGANWVIGHGESEALLHERILKSIEISMEPILDSNRNAKFMIFLGLNMPNEWKFENPEELIRLGDKTRLINLSPKDDTVGYLQESPNSKAVLAKVRNSLKTFITKLRKKPYASKIIGVTLHQGRAGENYWGLNINQYKDTQGRWVLADRDKYVFGDYGLGYRRHLAEWLKKQYPDKQKLQNAWKVKSMDYSDVTDSRKWPIRRFMNFLAWRQRPDGKFMFRDRIKENWLYHDYTKHQNEARANLFIEAAKAIKQASNGKLIVGGYIGYTVNSITNSPPALAQHSGHLAMKLARTCPDFDFACSPHFYNMRRQGDPTMPYATYDSLKLNGKLWINEFDSRTYLSSILPKTFSSKESREVLQKEFAFAFTKDQGWWWLEFPFAFTGARGASWFSDPMLLKDARVMNKQYKESMREAKTKSKSEIAVFFNEEQGYYTDAYSPANTVHSNLVNFVLPTLQKVGAPHDLFAQGDLKKFTENNFYKSYKLIIFLNAFHISKEERKIINEKLKSDGRTLLFFYAPGYQGNLNKKESELSIKGIEEITEMKGVRKLDEMHILGMAINNNPSHQKDVFNAPGWSSSGQIKRYGQKIGPIFYLESDNNKWESLAFLRIDNKTNGDKTALAKLQKKDYSVWYSTIPYLPLKELVKVVKESGVHIYCVPGVIVYANNNYIAVHSGRAQHNLTIKSKSAKDWFEIFEKKNYGKNCQIIKINIARGETKVFKLSNPIL